MNSLNLIRLLAGVAALVAAGQASADSTGKWQSSQEVYNKVCVACHATGVMGAPKVGSKELWEPRLTQGLTGLVNNALSGIRAMPAKGGDPSLTEANLRDAISYMLDQTGIKADATAK